jgi:dolichyl-phosphate-mannose--protein O-mannosyl transferase
VTPTPAGSAAGAAGRPLSALAATPALILLLLGGLALRLTIAYVLYPASGFASDLATYTSWSLTLASHGPAGFYANAGFADYPPAYLYVLWPIGAIAQALGGNDPASVAAGLIKLPAMLVDLAAGWFLYRLVLGWTWPGRRAEALALGAAALYVFNPVTIYDSALWGQTDAVGALVILLAVAALIRGNSEGAAALAVLAALVKPQFGVVAIPLVGIVLVRRHLLRPGSGPRRAPWGPSALRGWLAREQGPLRLVTSAIAGLATFFVLALPFGLGIAEYLDLMSRTAGGYAYLTVNAYNPWAMIGSGGNPSLAEAFAWSDDTVALLGPIPGVAIGAVLLVAGFAWAILRAGMRDDRWTVLVAASFLAIAFFILPTRVHERYLFPVFAILPLLAVADRRWLVALVAIAAGSFMNLHAILTIPLYATQNVADLPLGALFREFPMVLVSVALQTAAFAFAALALVRRDARDPYELAAGEVAGSVSLVPAPDGARPVGMTGADGDATTTGWAPGPGALVPVAPAGPGLGERLAARVSQPRLRRDRSASLASERGGRITWLDVALMLLVFVSALAVRGFNLARPYDMYFDEVYHARTGMEFLQHWRYGETHSIYEYTHPHLAKYAMAVSVDLLGDNRVTREAGVGADGVTAAAVEVRWSPDDEPALRNGDRLFVATATGLAVFDLRGDDRETTIATDATALAVDPSAHALFLVAPDGSISRLDTTGLDAARADPALAEPAPEPFASLPAGSPVTELLVTDAALVALRDDGSLVSLDADAGTVTGSAQVGGARALEALPSVERVVARPAEVTDPAGTALALADDLLDDADRIRALLESDAELVVIAGYLDDGTKSTVRGHVDDGTLPGIGLEYGPVIGVAGDEGVALLDATTLADLDTIELDGPAYGLGLVPSGLDDPVLYVATDDAVRSFRVPGSGPTSRGTIPVPAEVGRILWNEPSNLVHVLGRTPDGAPTVYVIEPHGDSLFADARLPFEPVALAMDTQPERPAEDRTSLIAVAADGRLAGVNVGGNAWAWRLPGVLLGALTAVVLYLLARLLFRRRAVAVFAAVLVLVEGMLFANARIAMNDVYVTFFIVAALTLFVGLWLGRWRRGWQVAAGLIGVGLLLGLGLASKWVAAYAIGGIVLLVLFRSALGRLLALAGMIGLTAVLGAMAIRPADVEDPSRNWLFLVIMVALTVALAATIVRRPVRFTVDELRFAVAVPGILGVLLLVGGFVGGAQLPADGMLTGTRAILLGAGLLIAAAAIGAGSWLGGRVGIGPLARRMPVDPDEPAPAPPPDGWLRPGAAAGIPWLFALGCLTVIPVAVYVVGYLPWVDLGNRFWEGFPAGNGGQTLWDLTRSMYEYHDNLRATHAASSPWWAWLLDLKPVWFYQDSFANDTAGSIYDSGNLVIFWMGIVGVAFAAWAAWVRRSLALTAIVVMFCAMWLPWARIDRATFQYHVYTSLPYVVLALAYLLAELWHGPSRVGWTVARAGAALAILGAPLLWLFRQPLCGFAGTEEANPGGQACADTVTRELPLSEQAIASVLVLAAGAIVALWVARVAGSGPPGGARSRFGRLLDHPGPALLATVGLTLGGLVAARALFSAEAASSLRIGAEQLAVVGLLLLAVPAWLVLRARDPRRVAVGITGAAVVFFVAWYPNLSGLPLPDDFVNVYQGLLPTWNYAFQFAVNTDPPVRGSMIDASTVVVGAATLLFVGGVMVMARAWRPARTPGSRTVGEAA